MAVGLAGSLKSLSQHGCGVVGVDMSERTRELASTYVQSGDFLACSREMLDSLVEHGFKADAAIAIWVLQHCFAPSEDLDRIKGALKRIHSVWAALPNSPTYR
jgi:Methyltransferase domain